MLFIHVALIKPTAINPLFGDRDPWRWRGVKARAFQRASFCFCEPSSTHLHPGTSVSGATQRGGGHSSAPRLQLPDGRSLPTTPARHRAASRLSRGGVLSSGWLQLSGDPARAWASACVTRWGLCPAASVGTGELMALEALGHTCARVQLLQNDTSPRPARHES